MVGYYAVVYYGIAVLNTAENEWKDERLY